MYLVINTVSTTTYTLKEPMENLTEQQEKEFEEFEAERNYKEYEGEDWYFDLKQEESVAMDNMRWEIEYGPEGTP
jgi:hypothetical protein